MKLTLIRHGETEGSRRDLYYGAADIPVLPDSLKVILAQHLERLRKVFEEDRAAGVAGTWLPPPVEHKIPKAGESWAWQWLFPSRQMFEYGGSFYGVFEAEYAHQAGQGFRA